MENLTSIQPSAHKAEGLSLSLDTVDEISKRLVQVQAIAWLMGHAHSEDLNQDSGMPAPELSNAAWAVPDLLEQVEDLIHHHQEVRHD